MKVIIVLASFLVATNALSQGFIESFVKKVKDFGAQCATETNAAADDVNLILAHKIPASHEGKCLLFCIHKKFELQNDDGTLNPEGGIKALDAIRADDPEAYDKVRKVAMTCGAKLVVDADPCVTAATLGECFVKEGQAAGFTPDMFEI